MNKGTSHSERVFEAIKSGENRPALICKKTCLGPQQVSDALRELRKKKMIVCEDGKYRKMEP